MIDSSNAFGVRERIEQLHISNDELIIKGKPKEVSFFPTPPPTSTPTPSPTPEGTPFPTPTPSSTFPPTSTPDGTPFPTPTPSDTFVPTPTPTSSPSPTPSPTPTQLLFPYFLQGPGNPVEEPIQKVTLTTTTSDIFWFGPYNGVSVEYTSMSIFVNGEFRSIVSFTKDRLGTLFGYGYFGATVPQAYGVFAEGQSIFLTITI